MREPSTVIAHAPGAGVLGDGEDPPAKPKLKKLRLALVLVGLGALALVSTVFGMMMAVAGDLPKLENQAEFRNARNSLLIADNKDGTRIARLTGNQNRILLGPSDISPSIRNAVIAIEDRRFYEHEGVDYRGIARALWQDLLRRKAVQGGSTITQQFVKNATEAQGDRSVFQKLREAALAYHLERQWAKQKILTQYLNTVYFGNGAYGIESAVRTYFRGQRGYDPNQRAARTVAPHEAALLAGMIASPSAYDPIQNPRQAKERRDLVLRNMLEQRSITRPEYENAVRQALPSVDDIQPPQPISDEPYFSTWVTQELVDRYGSGRVFGGGLRVKTTIDPAMQQAAEASISKWLSGIGPTASLVAIENKTGEVKAMVGGSSFSKRPFNLATNGHRQPGSAFKPFILVEALRQGVGPGATFTSKKKVFPVPGSRKEKFVVENYEDQYSGITTLAGATAQSDNSVYAELGLRLGTRKIARLGRRMGLRTRVSSNPAMTLGGLKVGVTPLEMAFAYSTIANKGKRVSGSLAASRMGPVAIEEVRDGDGELLDRNERRSREVYPLAVGEQTRGLLKGVIDGGTGEVAKLSEWAGGKTGTTENYGDAWFVGFNNTHTVAVWVGYPDRLKQMKTEYRGQPVAGGTYPAQIWHDFMVQAIKIRDSRKPKDKKDEEDVGEDGVPAAPVPGGPAPAAPDDGGAAPAPDGGAGGEDEGGSGGGAEPDEGGGQAPAPEAPPEQPAPAPQQPPAPAPQAPPPAGGGGGAGAARAPR